MSADDPKDVTTIAGLIAAADSGDAASAEALFAALYQELHRLAQRQQLQRDACSDDAAT